VRLRRRFIRDHVDHDNGAVAQLNSQIEIGSAWCAGQQWMLTTVRFCMWKQFQWVKRAARSSVVLVAECLLLACPSGAFATTQNLQSTLAFVYPMGDGSFVLGFTQGSTFCPSQNAPQYFYVMPGQNGVTVDGAKAMLATALTAFALGKTLSIAFDDSTTYCYVNRFSMQ
jgi:hypothetical protein